MIDREIPETRGDRAGNLVRRQPLLAAGTCDQFGNVLTDETDCARQIEQFEGTVVPQFDPQILVERNQTLVHVGERRGEQRALFVNLLLAPLQGGDIGEGVHGTAGGHAIGAMLDDVAVGSYALSPAMVAPSHRP